MFSKQRTSTSKIGFIALLIILLIGIVVISTTRINVYAQINNNPPDQIFDRIAHQVATANPGSSEANIREILVTLSNDITSTLSHAKSNQAVDQIRVQVIVFPNGDVAKALSQLGELLAAGNAMPISQVMTIVPQNMLRGQPGPQAIIQATHQVLSGTPNIGTQSNTLQITGATSAQEAEIRDQIAQRVASKTGVSKVDVSTVVDNMFSKFSSPETMQQLLTDVKSPSSLFTTALSTAANELKSGHFAAADTITSNIGVKLTKRAAITQGVLNNAAPARIVPGVPGLSPPETPPATEGTLESPIESPSGNQVVNPPEGASPPGTGGPPPGFIGGENPTGATPGVKNLGGPGPSGGGENLGGPGPSGGGGPSNDISGGSGPDKSGLDGSNAGITDGSDSSFSGTNDFGDSKKKHKSFSPSEGGGDGGGGGHDGSGGGGGHDGSGGGSSGGGGSGGS